MKKNLSVIDQIDALLPQTQCGLCEYDGCLPYAEAIANEDEEIDRCLPGGVRTLVKLGKLMGRDPTPLIPGLQEKAKPLMKAVIREPECIGCTKCIQACPVDAIIGSAKQMHTIITDECTGCELCVEPCPVDCIDMLQVLELSEEKKQSNANQARRRFQFRNARLQRDKLERAEKHQRAKLARSKSKQEDIVNARKSAIKAAVARVKLKKTANTSRIGK